MNNELIGTITNNNPDITTDVETSNIEGELNTTVVDYGVTANKPKINNVTLTGNKSLEDLGINIPTKVSDLQNDSGYITSYTETDPVFSASVASGITEEDIEKWNTQSGGTSDYTKLTNKPSVNNVELSGNKSLNDLGVQPAGDYALNSAIPTKVSQLTNDSGYITSYSETDPVFTASVAHGITSTDITNWNNKSTFSGDYNDLTNKPTIPTVPTNVSAFTNDAGYLSELTILSYGHSTWSDFIEAYNKNKVIYTRASSASDPGSGSQTRMAFMAYVNDATNPTEVEFQYYRSVSTHSASQQGDQIYIYKLNKTSGWTVTVHEASIKIAAGTGLTSSYANGTLTLSSTIDVSGKLDTSKVKTSTSTTSGDVYDVTYINSALGDIESLLGGI